MWLCADDQAKLERGRQQILDMYGHDPNVTGVGIGIRRRAGEWTGEPAVMVLVAKKRPAGLISRRRLLPQTVEVDGTRFGVDVVQGGPFTSRTQTATAPDLHTAAPTEITERMRPPRQGCSISNLEDQPSAGTLGLFVIDNTDNQICLLSANHVIGRMGRGKQSPVDGDRIIQPGEYDAGKPADAIARLKRCAPMPASGTRVDGAIAHMIDQNNYTLQVARDLMAPISYAHRVLGMVAAGDGFGGCVLTRMDATIQALNVRLPFATPPPAAAAPLPCAGPSPGLADPQPGMNIEKVGRTTAYTSSVIVAIGVQATVGTVIGPIVYQDLIYTEFFALPGDSGSVVFHGGDGKTQIPPPMLPPCIVLATLSDYYDLPLTQDNPLADKVRDQFFLQSMTGKFLVQLTYVNSQSVIDRLNGGQGSPEEVSYAQEYYAKYRDFMVSVLNDPNSPEVVTQEHLNDANHVINGLEDTVLTPAEARLAKALFTRALVPTKGMNRKQVQAYMDNPYLYSIVYEEVAKGPEIEMHAPFEPMPPEPTQ